MLKQFLLSACAASLLGLAACDEPTATLDCDTVRNDVQTTRGDTLVTSSGLRFIDIRIGTGAEVRSCRGVSVQYSGSFTDGTKFDPGGTLPFTPGVDNLITGFTQGVIGMKVGGIRRLIIPPELGYGAAGVTRNGQVVIPANATLVFDIEALGVE